jgi:hypothetical protein
LNRRRRIVHGSIVGRWSMELLKRGRSLLGRAVTRGRRSLLGRGVAGKRRRTLMVRWWLVGGSVMRRRSLWSRYSRNCYWRYWSRLLYEIALAVTCPPFYC